MSIEKKMEQAEKETVKLENGLEKDIKAIYQTSLDELRQLLFMIDSKYGNKDGIVSYAEMQKYDRMKKFDKDKNEIMRDLSSDTQKATIAFGSSVWLTNYYRTGYALETELQEKIGLKVIKPSDVEVVNPDMELSMKNNATFERFKVDNVIKRGWMQGKSTKQIAKDLKEQLGKNAENSMLTARTAMTRLSGEATQKVGEKAKAKGIDLVKKWNATPDDRTRDRHAQLDQTLADKDGYFRIAGYEAQYPGGFGAPEMDYYCRCRITFVPRGMTEAQYRRTREDGVIPYTNYNDWHKNRVIK